jgi:hypothetical protein
MNRTTWLNEQSLLVRNALLAGNLGEARNALRFTFEDEENDNTIPDGIRPAMIIRLALFPMSRENLDKARETFRTQAEETFTADDDLDAEIRMDMFSVLRERRTFG